MTLEKERQIEAQNKVKKLLAEAEEKRKQQRFAHGLELFAKGDLRLLENDEFIKLLPAHVDSLIESRETGAVQTILYSLGQALTKGELSVREKAAIILSIATIAVIETGQDGLYSQIYEILLEWVELESEVITGYEVLTRQIQTGTERFLNKGNWERGIQFFQMLKNIESGKNQKRSVIKSLLSKIRDNICTDDMLRKLYENYFVENDPELENLLTSLGDKSLQFAVDLLRVSEDPEEVEALVRLIGSGGSRSVGILRRSVRKNDPWQTIRNLLLVVQNVDDERYSSLIDIYLDHQDIRVQCEVIKCVFSSDSPARNARLGNALFTVDDSLREMIIRELCKSGSQEVGIILTRFVDDFVVVGKHVSEQVFASLLTCLENYPTEGSLKSLNRVVVEMRDNNIPSQQLELVDETRMVLDASLRRERHKVSLDDEVYYDHDPQAEGHIRQRVADAEAGAAKLVGERRLQEAAQLLLDASVACANEKEFGAAERLRDRILQVDPSAYILVMKAEELIEAERQSIIPGRYFAGWKVIVELLGRKAFEAIYGESDLESYSEGEIIATEGERDGRLYFIDEGEVSLSCNSGSKETFLKRLPAGTIIGGDQFFSASVWTITVRAVINTHLHAISREALSSLEQEHPGLEDKLYQYCSRINMVPDLLRMSGDDRRNTIRFPVALKIEIRLMDVYGGISNKKLLCKMIDISQGGACLSIGIANRRNAYVLLGRKLRIEVEILGAQTLSLDARIVGIQPEKGTDSKYKLNVKFASALTLDMVERVVSSRTF